MKCDEFLIALKTGGPLDRRRARQHAGKCIACSAIQKKLDEAMEKIAVIEVPDPRLRRMWEKACGAQIPESMPPASRWPWFVVGAVAMIAVLVFAVVTFYRPAPPLLPVQVVRSDHRTLGPVTVEIVDSQPELLRLGGEASLLQAKLEGLTLQAERDDAQRQVSLAINQFSRW